jgi:hypothetical protein
LRKEKGITLIVLIITIIIMLILIGAGIQTGTTSVSEIKLQNFSYELQQVHGKVDGIYQRMIMEDNTNYVLLGGKPIGQNMTASGAEEARRILKEIRGIEYKLSAQGDENLYVPGTSYTTYRYFSKNDLNRYLDIRNSKRDMIINFKTKDIISVQGEVYDGIEYHRLEEL